MSDYLHKLEQTLSTLVGMLTPIYGSSGTVNEVSPRFHTMVQENLPALTEGLARLKQHNASQDSVGTLLARISELEDELEPYTEERQEREAKEARQERLQAIVDLLFPTYDSVLCGNYPEKKPPVHPGKSNWWNGAAIHSETEIADGTLMLQLSSYVGGGRRDQFSTTISLEWLQANDLRSTVHQWIAQETSLVEERDRMSKIANARRIIDEQTRQLAALDSSSN